MKRLQTVDLEDLGSTSDTYAAAFVDVLLTGRRDQEDKGPEGKQRSVQQSDVVTPGDLWSSPTFVPVAVLHRPPER